MYEYELEGEYELESEWELEGEFEGESEWEAEGEWEGEYESEEFLRVLGRLARSPALRRIGLTAARSALGALGPSGNAVGGLLPQSELESELEGEGEWEWEAESEAVLNPIRRVYPQAMMEHFGHAAATAESEAEAEAFIGALIPLAARLLPQLGSAVMRVAPQLIRGASRVARTLRTSPVTRPLVRALPAVVRSTTADLARQVSRGQPLTAQGAVRTLARNTARTLSNPQRCTQVIRRAQALDRRYHQTASPAAR
jgi:hypothetical protein